MPGDVAYTIPSLVTQGPQYADLVNTALAAIQTHNHDGVDAGALIDLSAQQCTTDLSIDSHNLTDVRSIDFVNNPSTLTGSQDVLCIYVDQGNLYYNTSDGTPVQLTNGNVPAVPALAFENFIPRSSPITANATVLYTDTYNLINLNSSGGSFTITLPIANAIQPVAVGRLYLFRDVANACGTHPVSISVATGSGNTFGDSGATTFTLSSSGAYVAIFTDGVSKWWTWTQNNFNDEKIRLDNESVLQVAGGSAIAVTSNGSITLDSTSEFASSGANIIVVGGEILVGGATQIGYSASTSVTYETTTSETFQGGSGETFQSGASCEFDSGSVLQLDSGSTCTSAGILNISGTTTISGSGTTLTGTMAVTGQIIGSATAVINNQGYTQQFGERSAFTVINAGTYNVDVDSGFIDNCIGIETAASGTWTIRLPAAPAEGRRLRIFCANAYTSGGTVILDGNSQQVCNNSALTLIIVSYSTSLVTQYALDLIYTGVRGWSAYAALNIAL